MNIEENRLQTFDEWPADTVVTPERIAKAGFYSLKQDLIVQCFSCGARISEWNYGDQVMAKHRQLNPQCPFVVDPSTSGNVPKISANSVPSISHPPPPSDSVFLKDEAVRLQTYVNWPVPEIVSPESLARAGFYYLKQNDRTKCAFCNGIVASWEQGDNPDREHRRHFPECSFVQTTINPRLEGSPGEAESTDTPRDPTFTNLNLVSQENFQELGIQTHTAPKRPRFTTYESRLATFTLWPIDLIQTPEMLAHAGFYYEGRGDQVRCFHCDGGLRHWDPHDDPWTEHARWFPRCSFVQLIKGKDFINACAIEQNNTSNLEEVASKSDTTPSQRKEITDRELRTYLVSAPVLAALDVGLSVGRIKQALREKLERTGTGFTSADALIEATLNLQHEEEDSSADTEPQLSRAMVRLVGEMLEAEQASSERRNIPKEAADCQTKKEKNEDVATLAKISKTLSLEEENRLLKEARLCKICMDNEVGIVFLPCGHLATCVNCAPNLQDCPVCRSSIKATVRTFLS